MMRLCALALAAWLPSATVLVAEPVVAEECSSCTARHKSLQALQSLRTGQKSAELPGGPVPDRAERDPTSLQPAGSDPCLADPKGRACRSWSEIGPSGPSGAGEP